MDQTPPLGAPNPIPPTPQPINSPQPTPPPPPAPPPQPNAVPIWQSDAFIILALVIFWPIGLILMWKYAKWRAWAKGLLTAVFLIAAAPILFIWSLLFGLNTYSFVENIVSPQVNNQSQLYNCVALDKQWGKCTNSKYKFSFEYPVKWNYVDLSSEGIGFSPSDKDIRNNFIIGLDTPQVWQSEEKAKDFAKGSFSGQELNINGLYAVKRAASISGSVVISYVTIVDGKTTYQFSSFPDNLKETGVALSPTELQSILEHVANSFIKEK